MSNITQQQRQRKMRAYILGWLMALTALHSVAPSGGYAASLGGANQWASQNQSTFASASAGVYAQAVGQGLQNQVLWSEGWRGEEQLLAVLLLVIVGFVVGLFTHWMFSLPPTVRSRYRRPRPRYYRVQRYDDDYWD